MTIADKDTHDQSTQKGSIRMGDNDSAAPRTTITKTGANEVTLIGVDPLSGEDVTWTFWVPMRGGYVRKGATHSAEDSQVCNELAGSGPTLTATGGFDLLRVVRREWHSRRRKAAKMRRG